LHHLQQLRKYHIHKHISFSLFVSVAVSVSEVLFSLSQLIQLIDTPPMRFNCTLLNSITSNTITVTHIAIRSLSHSLIIATLLLHMHACVIVLLVSHLASQSETTTKTTNTQRERETVL